MSERNRNAVAAYTARDVMVPDGFNENVDLILQTYAKDLTPQEFSLFAADAHARGLSIVKRQIYATKYGGKMTIMVGIDGYRSQAESHAEYAGQDGPYWCGEDGVWRDVWLAKEPPAAAKVGIYRTGFAAPVVGIATWAEYASPGRDMWKKFPATMLAKCAEAQAIRKAFPSKLGGTYVAEEMDQAHAIETPGRVVNQQTGEIRQQDALTDRQRNLIQALRKDLRMDAIELDRLCLDFTAHTFDDLTKDDAKAVIDEMKTRLLESARQPHPAPASETEWTDAEWDAAIEELDGLTSQHDIADLIILAYVQKKGYRDIVATPPSVIRSLAHGIATNGPQPLFDWWAREDDLRRQHAPDAPQSAGNDVQDAEVVEATGSASQAGLTIEMSEEDEAQYRNKRRAAQAGQ